MFSCKGPKDEPQIKYKIKSFNTILLHYDELDYGAYPKLTLDINLSFNYKISLQYNEFNEITSSLGGFATVPSSTNQNYVCMSNNVVDKIQIKDGFVLTENEYPYAKYDDTIKYVIKNGKLQKKIVLLNYFNQKLEYTYQYENNKIVENLNGLQTSVFYLTNGNVTKIEKYQYNNSKEIISKTEFLYSDYDQSINLLKGYYYIHGAFFSAFSTNNYKKREVNTYTYSNNQYTQISISSITLNYNVDSNNIPDLFEYENY